MGVRGIVKMRESAKDRKPREKERAKGKHLLANAYCVFLAQGEIVTT